MENCISERVKALFAHYKTTANAFARKTGFRQGSISEYFTGKTSPNLAFVMLILEEYPDVSADWLLRGEGSMLKSENAGNMNVVSGSVVGGDVNQNINSGVDAKTKMRLGMMRRGCKTMEELELLIDDMLEII